MAGRFLDQEFLESEWGADEVARLAEEAAVDGGGTAAEVIEAAIAAAEADGMSRLSGRYADADLPDSPDDTPDVLKGYLSAYAMKALTKRHDVVADKILRAITDANSWFSGVATGRYSLGLTDAPAVDQGEALIWSDRTVGDAVFSDLDDM